MKDQHGYDEKPAKDQQQNWIRTMSVELDPDRVGGFWIRDEGLVDLEKSQIDFQIVAWKNVDHQNGPKWRFGCSFPAGLKREEIFLFLKVVGGFLFKCADDLLDDFFNITNHN